MFQFLQRVGKSLMLPIAVLPAAALLLRLGQPDLLDIPFMAQAGDAIFANLALLFALGIAVGLSKDGSGAAALAGVIGYFVLTKGAVALDKTIDMGVLGGIVAGIVAGLLYNRFSDIKLPEWLGFFAGKRFVPIITSVVMLAIAGLFGVIWPPIQDQINNIGEWLTGAGALGAGIFGFLNRMLIPLGLHHILNSLVWFVFGEFNGATGDLNRFFKGDPTAGTFMTGFFPVMMFGLPAAALAMVAAAKKEKRKLVSGMLIGLAFTSFLTGITEPIEFLFMFIAPVLYIVHALLTGISMGLAVMLDIHHGFGFSAGAIDYFLNFGIAQKPLLLGGIGLIYAATYFALFYWLIKALNLKTPGREDDETDGEEAVVLSDDKHVNMAAHFIEGLGGKENLVEIDNCATRLRLQVKDSSAVNEGQLKKNGARGVMKVAKTSVQVIVGTEVEFVANAMKQLVRGEKVMASASVKADPKPSEGVLDEFSLPFEGVVMPLEKVPDQVFSAKLMGDGFAIEPVNNALHSPISGEVISIFPTKHAFGLKTDTGLELLIHVGIDTVELKGEGFTTLVNEGERIEPGTPLLQIDLDYVKKNATSLVTPVVFTNLPEGKEVEIRKTGYQKQGAKGVIKLL
ncbi:MULTISPECIES: N-acetylglucosamine-specific PTS transporter subunit IIBC [Priestia]|uniref:PTS transporter subunit EIIC n=1 Tax=Priestia flexa TaxID=86664 RepID=A0A8I1MHY7_9BACI|nr:N-acetylglucosamine-specific PTS transporter subunit IIBC [Priestia flexa]AQX55499.1 PTS N-acetyl glucosamine transporter subunit IIABC [Priestia flexa]MBN8252622.1 PTS transporter subunit EIIC [Priestia flexa]MCM3067087.1 N-acetylglucosamine-specific PTS transporter subunit IIBC [Priestia flexa]MED4591115.1 N-acetylglucosamine-specific PTS transporter subunit IIBC [Priestia flexa]WHX80116.1 N-acetylglucosamine-specific PTS transporter subunit IIBC [Priestia flexa]